MNTEISSGGTAALDRFDAIERLLARYPHLADSELDDLKHWFAREASAFDVASLASKDALRDQYAQFRAEHIDRWSPRDIVLACAGAMAILGAIAVIAMMA